MESKGEAYSAERHLVKTILKVQQLERMNTYVTHTLVPCQLWLRRLHALDQNETWRWLEEEKLPQQSKMSWCMRKGGNVIF